MTIAGVLRWDLQGPISCQAANKLESKSSAPFNLSVYCKCCSHRSDVLKAEPQQFSIITTPGHMTLLTVGVGNGNQKQLVGFI